VANDFSDPPDGFTKSNLDHVLTNAIDNLGLSEEDAVPNGGFYLIFTPPDINSASGAAAFHTSTTDFDFPFDFDTWHYAWIGNFHSQDYITNSISHEVMEALTDPNGDGIHVHPGDEISDGEALNYAALIGGYEVASFWSASDNAYAVYDGNSQVVTFDNGNLMVNGDQFGAGSDDTITVDLNSEGQPLITLNGESFSFTSDPFISRVTSITINPGAGNNTINIERTNFSAPVTIVGSSRDTVNIGFGGSTQGIQGNVFIENPPSFTTINVDDSADTAPRDVILSTFTPPGDSDWGSLNGLAPAAISYEFNDTSSITINTGASATIDVLSTGTSTSLVGHGDTTVNVGDGGSVQGIFGALNISNPPSFTTINVDDSADTTARSATLDTFTASDGSAWGSISGLAPASISYKQTDTNSPITIDAGSGADNFTAVSLPFQAIDLNTGDGNDTVTLQTSSGGLVVDGQGGTNTLIGPSAAATWNITGTNAGNIAGVDTFKNFQNLTGGSAGDTFKFSNGKSISGRLDGGGGSDTLDYSSFTTGVSVDLTAGTAPGTGGAVNIENVTGTRANDHITGNALANVIKGNGGIDVLNGGSGGADTFVLAPTQGSATTVSGSGTDDTLVGAGIANTWTITGTNAGNVNGIAFTGIAKLTGGTFADVFKFTTGSVSGTVDGGGGTDTLDYSADGGAAVTVNLANHTATRTGGIANIEKLVGSSSAADILVGPNAASIWSITGANAGTVGNFSFSAVENLTGGSANDTFRFAAAGSESGLVSGGLGANTLDYSLDGGSAATVNLATLSASRTGGFAGIQGLIGSSSAADKLIGANATNLWSITGTNAGKVGTFNFSAVENLTGGSDVDEFVFSNGKGISGALNGGAGNNWLDFAPYTTHVTVNLATGTATGVSGGIAGIRNVRGGSGGNTLTGNGQGNILIGGVGVDTITGGSGRSILIGGRGNDSVQGGSADDIVIGGFTDFDSSSDAHDQALMAILTEWQSSDSYSIRISKIKAGVGAGSAKFLFGTTVHDDGNASALTGGGGTDWFFKGTHDTVTDQAAGEQLN
jgi:Ca2+-binding RTX toxin-like protein